MKGPATAKRCLKQQRVAKQSEAKTLREAWTGMGKRREEGIGRNTVECADQSAGRQLGAVGCSWVQLGAVQCSWVQCSAMHSR